MGGKQNKISITNDKGRLSKEEIERMVSDAEKFKADDEKQKDRISPKNGLESYCFNMKTTIEDEKLKDKISEDDRKKINDKCDEAIKWLDANSLLRLKSSMINRKRWKVCVTLSSQSCTRLEVVCLEVCPVPPVVCLIWVVHLAAVPLVLDPVQDPPSRRLTKFT